MAVHIVCVANVNNKMTMFLTISVLLIINRIRQKIYALVFSKIVHDVYFIIKILSKNAIKYRFACCLNYVLGSERNDK